MSGHSHWKSIKRTKETSDKKKGKVFSKLARSITVVAREGGGDPKRNSSLRLIIEEARRSNMPKENIERAIEKGTGEKEGQALESILLEAYGPGKTAIIIEGITDNRNRTLGDVKQILSRYRGKLASSGSVKWLFEREGLIVAETVGNDENSGRQREDLELKVIDSGAENMLWQDNVLEIYTKPEELEKVKQVLEKDNVEIVSASLCWIPKEPIEVNDKDKGALQKLFETLDDNDAVQEIYSNLKFH